MIKSSGYRISSTEIEEVLYTITNIKYAVVFGIPDNILGQKIIAIVTLKNNSNDNAASLKEHCALHLAPYMVPKVITIKNDLPLG